MIGGRHWFGPSEDRTPHQAKIATVRMLMPIIGASVNALHSVFYVVTGLTVFVWSAVEAIGVLAAAIVLLRVGRPTAAMLLC